MERLHAIATGTTRVGAVAGGALLLVASLIICIDIVMRYAFAWTVGGADDLAGYALAIASAWGFSAALLTRSHIRIDTVYVRVRRSLRAALDVASLASFIFFIGLVTMHAWGVLEQSYRSGSRSLSEIEVPMVLPQGLWFAGLLWFLLVALLLLWSGVNALVRGDTDQLFALIGSKSAVAEAQEEIAAIETAFEAERKL